MGQIWFGTRGHERWVNTPAIGADISPHGYSNETGYLSGGMGLSQSVAAHMEYAFSWNLASRATIRAITDFAAGVYGTGLIYFVDPMAADVNLLPQHWATPSQGGYDAPPLILGQVPTLSDTDLNTHAFPAESATYTVDADSEGATLYIPIPPGMTLQVGFVGSATGSTNVTATDASGTTDLTLLAVGDTDLTNASFTGWVEFAITGAGTITLTAATAVLAADAVAGEWASGQGHSGCEFDKSSVQTVAYASRRDLQGLTATLKEVGAWQA